MTSSNENIFRVTGLFVRGIHRSPVNSSHRGKSRGTLMFSLICVWTNIRINIGDASDLRRHPAHYDDIVMYPDVIARIICRYIFNNTQLEKFPFIWRQLVSFETLLINNCSDGPKGNPVIALHVKDSNWLHLFIWHEYSTGHWIGILFCLGHKLRCLHVLYVLRNGDNFCLTVSEN